MDEFGFNSMSDDEFRRIFSKILNERQREMKKFLNSFYGNDFFNPRGGFSGQSKNLPFFEDYDIMKNGPESFYNIFNNFFNQSTDDMEIKRGNDEFGPWENKSWTSPDGTTSYNSFKRYFHNPEETEENFQNDLDTIKILEMKLNKAVKEEKYEEAAKIRDLINSLKEDKK